MANTPTDAAERKALPIVTGVLDYFPDALLAVAEVSRIGNDQHNPGQPLHWSKDLSTDHADSLLRHLIDRGTIDTDGTRHSAKVAWRALALLQVEIERDLGPTSKEEPSYTMSGPWSQSGAPRLPIRNVPAPEDKLPLESSGGGW
ncbi:hypothetical protein EHM76_00910 [bacterium]|nr:MAG: hypothetical protein EHM76_00910 [bacterium]